MKSGSQTDTKDGTGTRLRTGVRYKVMAAVKSCGPPPLIVSGYIKSSGPYYPNGTRAEYSCFTGYKLQGASYIICTSGSVWSSLPPTCEPWDGGSSMNTDIDVRVNPQQDPEGRILMLIIVGAVLSLLLLCLLFVLCCKAAGLDHPRDGYRRLFDRCFHGNAVLPERTNYRLQGSCCCKRYVVTTTNQRTACPQSEGGRPCAVPTAECIHDNEVNPTLATGRHDNDVVKGSDGTVDHPDSGGPYRTVSRVKKPAIWMPHANPVRSINTSTK